MPTHVVKFGEHLAQIAYERGFSNFTGIFERGENAGLKSRRKTPHILAPGDKVFFSEPATKEEPNNATEQRHRFRVKSQELKLLDRSEKPLKNQKVVLGIEAETCKAQTDDKGLVERVIPPPTLQGRLTFKNAENAIETDAALLVGGLEPIDTDAGQIGRLNNLGYFAGDPARPPGAPPAPDEEPDPEAGQRFLSAVEEFQADHGLTVDGKCGAGTQAKLRDVHGC